MGRATAARNFVSVGCSAEEAAGGGLGPRGRGRAVSAQDRLPGCVVRGSLGVSPKGILRSRLLPPERLSGRRAELAPAGAGRRGRAGGPARRRITFLCGCVFFKSPALPELGHAAESTAVRCPGAAGVLPERQKGRGGPGPGQRRPAPSPAGSPVELAGRWWDVETCCQCKPPKFKYSRVWGFVWVFLFPVKKSRKPGAKQKVHLQSEHNSSLMVDCIPFRDGEEGE